MKLNVRQIGHVAVVDLVGKITVGEGDTVLREGVFKLLQSDQKQILLNLRKVPYIDSSGIGEMVACYKAARAKDGTVKSLNPSERVSDLLQITRLEGVFETYRSEEEALRSF
jgi:anti-sigma B factor antagonist